MYWNMFLMFNLFSVSSSHDRSHRTEISEIHVNINITYLEGDFDVRPQSPFTYNQTMKVNGDRVLSAGQRRDLLSVWGSINSTDRRDLRDISSCLFTNSLYTLTSVLMLHFYSCRMRLSGFLKLIKIAFYLHNIHKTFFFTRQQRNKLKPTLYKNKWHSSSFIDKRH